MATGAVVGGGDSNIITIPSTYKFNISNGFSNYIIPKATLDALTPSGYKRLLTLVYGGGSANYCIGVGAEFDDGYRFNISSGYSTLSNFTVNFYIVCVKA